MDIESVLLMASFIQWLFIGEGNEVLRVKQFCKAPELVLAEEELQHYFCFSRPHCLYKIEGTAGKGWRLGSQEKEKMPYNSAY